MGEVGVRRDQRWRIAWSYADRGRARSIGGLDHRLPARRQQQPDAWVTHQGSRRLAAVVAEPLHEAGGRASGKQLLLDHHADLFRNVVCSSTGAENDGVAALDRDQRFEDERRNRVDRGHQANDHSHGTGDLGHLPFLVEADLAVACLARQALVDPGAGDRVLECLVANVPHSGFDDRGDRQGMRLIGDHRRQGAEERIDPRLAPIFNLALRGESLAHERLDDRMSDGRRRLGSG